MIINDGLGAAYAIRDMTDRKHIERALSDKNIELQNAAEAKNRFLADMSHELGTPLNAIIGFTGTMLMRFPEPLKASQENQLSSIRASARHLLSSINDFLDLAKMESGKVEFFFKSLSCMNVIIGATRFLLRPIAPEIPIAEIAAAWAEYDG